MKNVLFASLLCISGFLAPAQAAIIDFDALEAAGTGYAQMSVYEEDGFRLSAPTLFASARQNQVGWYAGSAGLFNDFEGDASTLTRIDGAVFSVFGIDLARVSLSYASGAAVSFIGHVHGGGTVNQTVTVGEALAFQHFLLTGFSNLDSMTWVQSSPFHQFDNIDTGSGQVPEPAPLALLALGLAALAARRRAK